MNRAGALIVAFVLGCAQTESGAPEKAAATPASEVVAAAPAAEDEFVPADAQARAEAVLNEKFNKDKTTRLAMKMTTIVGRTSALDGFSTALQAREEKLEERLARLQARDTGTEVVIQLPGAILFDFDSAQIRPDAQRALDDVRQVIAAYGQRPVRVEGHTDAVASDEYNRRLSLARASAVAQWLTTNGVERARVTSAGLGETRPAAPNDTAEGRQRNRRVEIVIAKQ